LAGVSQSTVSRILSGDTAGFFSEKTRQQVLKIAAELGYSPNPIARALRGKHTNLIGVIVRDIADPFFASLISEFSHQARALGYHLVLGHAHSDANEALEMSSVLDTRHTEVLILGDLRDDKAAIQAILASQPAAIALCRGASAAGITTVNPDNEAGIEALLDHVCGLGHRRIGFIDGGWLGDLRERCNSFIASLRQRNIALNPEWIASEADDSAGGYRAMQRLLAARSLPTAVLAADDIMAIGALKAAHDTGLRVPEQVSITGFDGLEMGQFVSPALTTIYQPLEELTRQALQRLLEMIAGTASGEDRMIRIRSELVIRDSTGIAPAS
jgi:LacI family repressor for deo operon, udp, cdd, tsx, nupC, and nupG